MIKKHILEECLTKELNKRIEAGAHNLERLAIQQGTPGHIGEELQACARTLRRGLTFPTLSNKLAILKDYDSLLLSIVSGFAHRTAEARVMN